MCNITACKHIELVMALRYLHSPQLWPRRPVCFSKAANTNLDTVSNKVSLLRDALSQSATGNNAVSMQDSIVTQEKRFSKVDLY